MATVTFRAKLSSGSATVSFAGGSAAVKSGTNILGGTSSGTYSFTPPPPPPPPPDKTAPKITDVKVSKTNFKGATVEWKTNESASSIVEYGLNTKYGLSGQASGLTKNHKAVLASELLIPGETYHFRANSADAAGNTAKSEDGTFKTRGYTVKIKVVDQKGKGVEGAKVTLASEPLLNKTDKEGNANFEDVSPGKHLVTVEADKRIQSLTIEVKEASEKEIAEGKVAPQTFKVKVTAATLNLLPYILLLAIFILLILAAGSVVWWRTKGGFGKGKGGLGKSGSDSNSKPIASQVIRDKQGPPDLSPPVLR